MNERVKKKPLAQKDNHENKQATKITKSLFDPDSFDAPLGADGFASAIIFSRIMEETYSKEDIALKTELNDNQILVFSQAEAFSAKYDLPLLQDLVTGIMEKSVSRNRKGRKEFEAIAKASFNSIYQSEQDNGRKSIPDRLLGK